MSSYYEEIKEMLLNYHKNAKLGWCKRRRELKQLPYAVSIICKYCIVREEIAGYSVGPEAVQLISVKEIDLATFGEYVKKERFKEYELEMLASNLRKTCPWIYNRIEGLYQYRGTYNLPVLNMISQKIDDLLLYVIDMALRLVDGEKPIKKVARGREDITDQFTLIHPLLPKEVKDSSSGLLDFHFIDGKYKIVHRVS